MEEGTTMSLFDYQLSKKISCDDPPFASLIMAACRKADSTNLKRLQDMWPLIWADFYARYNAPGGLLPGENG
jgi:hypothetical protein